MKIPRQFFFFRKIMLPLIRRHEYKGRKLVVKEDFDTERDRFGRISRGGGDRGRDRDRGDRGGRSSSVGRGGRERSMGEGGYGNTYGLSPSFLQTLGIEQPLHTRIFVANVSFNQNPEMRKRFNSSHLCCLCFSSRTLSMTRSSARCSVWQAASSRPS